VKRLEKKVRKLEAEIFDLDMQLSEKEVKHKEALRKVMIRAKVLENSSLNQELKVSLCLGISFALASLINSLKI